MIKINKLNSLKEFKSMLRLTYKNYGTITLTDKDCKDLLDILEKKE